MSIFATIKLISDAPTEIAIPISSCCRAWGFHNRSQAVIPILIAAIKIMTPSAPLEKYSIFS
jgi:hypothetical protein